MSERTTGTKKQGIMTRLKAGIEEMAAQGISGPDIEMVCKAMARTMHHRAQTAEDNAWIPIGDVLVSLDAFKAEQQPSRVYRALVDLRRKFSTRVVIADVLIDFLIGKRAFLIDAEVHEDYRRRTLERYQYIPYFMSRRFLAALEDEDLVEFVAILSAEEEKRKPERS
jgi:hypothetical protein